MNEFLKAQLDIELSPEFQIRLESFRRKATELSNFVSSQNWGRHHVHVDRSNENKPRVDGTLPNELVLEALYRRFRFFILTREKSNYFRLLRLLSASSDDELLHGFLRLEKKEFFNERSLEFAFITANSQYKPEDVIDFWFNAYYFHDQAPDREKLSTFESIVSPIGAKVILWHAVWNSVLKIRNLNWLLRETSINNPVVFVLFICKI